MSANSSPENADKEYPELLQTLKNYLERHNIEPVKVIKVKGYRGANSTDCADSIINRKSIFIEHTVLMHNNVILDPCRLRLGSEYPLPSTYTFKQLREVWNTFKELNSSELNNLELKRA